MDNRKLEKLHAIIERKSALIDELADALEVVEWTRCENDEIELSCPNCGNVQSKGHYPECIVAVALAKVKK